MSKNSQMRKIELLAPAKNLEIAIEAINHGADAIYIGAPKFSARSAAGNTLEDIENLVRYAHQFDVRIYVALNTIMSDKELKEVETLIWQLYEIGVDALIIQDMGITMLNLPPIPLHASTQTDNRNLEKVKFLENTGFSQVVLARELTKDEIKGIADQTTVTLEAFVHGALCVCYSGQCYLSEAITRRSANRGSCAQLCRLPYDLVDSDNKKVANKKHLLSMKDLNLSEHLEEMIEAGVDSLKIEGRLKDMSYVKNTVAYYRKKINEIIDRYPEKYKRASSGISTYTFNPDLYKSFNRGYTSYFFANRTNDIWSLNSPKSIGEPIGHVSEIGKNYFKIDTRKYLFNGDGLCFLNTDEELEGMRINKIESGKIYCSTVPQQLKTGQYIYRNYDHSFEKALQGKTAERKIPITIELNETDSGFSLTAVESNKKTALINIDYTKEIAQKDQLLNIKNNLSKTGNTIFMVESVIVNLNENWFIPASILAEWRRQLIDKLTEERLLSYKREERKMMLSTDNFPLKEITYLGNVMNQNSRNFYTSHGSVVVEDAFEKAHKEGAILMFTRHCIKYSLGWCPKESKIKHPFKEPFFLTYENTKLELTFDCKQCEMHVSKA